MNEQFKSGFVSVVGRPNVGKSTLVNTLVQDKVAIMSDKPQTTRTVIRGIYTDDAVQIVFSDTPGMQTPRNKLGTFMQSASIGTLSQSDVIMMVVDESDYIGRKDQEIIEYVKKSTKPRILVINKIDKINQEQVLKRIQMYDSLHVFDEIIPISAIKNRNHERIIEVLKRYLPFGEAFYGAEQTTDQPTKVRIAEAIREKVLHYTDEEIPHGVMVEVESLRERKNDLIDILATIYVERENHKRILIGKQGHKIKGIGMAARKELEEMFGARVNLQLWVKTKQNWRENEMNVRNFGYNAKEL